MWVLLELLGEPGAARAETVMGPQPTWPHSPCAVCPFLTPLPSWESPLPPGSGSLWGRNSWEALRLLQEPGWLQESCFSQL